MRSNRSLFVQFCAGLGALALTACSGGNTNADASTDGSMDGTVTLPDGAVIHVSQVTGTWTPTPSGVTTDLTRVWGSGPNDVYTITTNNVLHYTGTSWPRYPSMNVLLGLSGSGMNDVWVLAITVPMSGSGEVGQIVMMHDPGTGFQESAPGLSPSLAHLGFSSPTNGWAVGPNATAAHYDGTAWTPQTTGIPATDNLSGVVAIGPTDAIAVGEHILRWNGTSWATEPTVNTTQEHVWYGAFASGPNDIWVVGQFGFIQHWDGTSWTDSDPGNDAGGGVLSVDLNTVWAAASNDVWAGGNDGTLIHFNGAHWTLVHGGGGSGPTANSIRSLWGSGPNDIYAVGDHGTILHYH